MNNHQSLRKTLYESHRTRFYNVFIQSSVLFTVVDLYQQYFGLIVFDLDLKQSLAYQSNVRIALPLESDRIIAINLQQAYAFSIRKRKRLPILKGKFMGACWHQQNPLLFDTLNRQLQIFKNGQVYSFHNLSLKQRLISPISLAFVGTKLFIAGIGDQKMMCISESALLQVERMINKRVCGTLTSLCQSQGHLWCLDTLNSRILKLRVSAEKVQCEIQLSGQHGLFSMWIESQVMVLGLRGRVDQLKIV